MLVREAYLIREVLVFWNNNATKKSNKHNWGFFFFFGLGFLGFVFLTWKGICFFLVFSEVLARSTFGLVLWVMKAVMWLGHVSWQKLEITANEKLWDIEALFGSTWNSNRSIIIAYQLGFFFVLASCWKLQLLITKHLILGGFHFSLYNNLWVTYLKGKQTNLFNWY